MTAMLEIDRLSKSFGPIAAVRDVSFAVGTGEVVGFLGPNGAGKTTTMRMAAGFVTPSAGTARIAGFDIGTDGIAAKAKLGYLPEGAPAYADMTPRAFLGFVAAARGMAYPEKRIDAVAERANIRGVLDQPIDTLSKGFKRRVGLAQAILHDPPVLILDEPTDGLDPNQKHEVRAMIGEMAATKSIVISTHILEEVEAICGRAIVIARGQVVADATPDALLADAPDHNAVRISTSVERVDALRTALEAAPEIGALERLDDDGGEATLIARPRGGGRIAGAVTGVLRAHPDLPISEIRTERGKLDDVFRALTAQA